jgi:hypothetical protein
MDWIEILKLIGILIAGLTVIVLILMNHLISRLLSMAFCGLSIYTAFANTGALEPVLWTCIWLTILGWLLFVGEGVLGPDTGWIIIDYMGNSFPEIVRGPFFHIFTSLLVFGLAYHYIALDHTIWFYLMPGGIILLDIISLIKGA